MINNLKSNLPIKSKSAEYLLVTSKGTNQRWGGYSIPAGESQINNFTYFYSSFGLTPKVS